MRIGNCSSIIRQSCAGQSGAPSDVRVLEKYGVQQHDKKGR